MSVAVTLDVFSGRTNPTWHLTESQEKELRSRMSSLTQTTHQRPSGAVGGLGYRGFTISATDLSLSPSGQFRVHEAIVDHGVSAPNLVDHTEIEKFLIETYPEALQEEVLQHVRASLSSGLSFTATLPPSSCPPCHAADAPAYNPGAWNIPTVQPYNNCYNYANDHATNTFAQPGRAHGVHLSVMDCGHVQPAAAADGLAAAPNFSAPLGAGSGWYVALVIWPGADYHWYRQDKVGCWSHKPGQTAARNVDNAGKSIVDPKTCNRGPYTVFCTYMVTKRGLSIS